MKSPTIFRIMQSVNGIVQQKSSQIKRRVESRFPIWAGRLIEPAFPFSGAACELQAAREASPRLAQPIRQDAGAHLAGRALAPFALRGSLEGTPQNAERKGKEGRTRKRRKENGEKRTGRPAGQRVMRCGA